MHSIGADRTSPTQAPTHQPRGKLVSETWHATCCLDYGHMAVLYREVEMSNIEVFFKWSADYSVNIPTIDAQHQELVNILNRLFIAVSNREGGKVIAGILDALMSYTQTHFSLEERLMKQANYKDLIPHMEEHRKLIAQLDSLCKKHLLEEKPIYFEMLSFLKTWLKEHIQGVDTKYSAALQQADFSVIAWEREATTEFEKMSDSKKWWELWKAA
jgi:hemerythrin